MNIDSLEKLYIHELKDLYSAEKQLVAALPKVVEACTDKDLKKAFASHLKETEQHVKRLEKIFTRLDASPKGHKCAGMEGLLKEASEMMQEEMPPEVMDAALISAAQRVEHYEMAGYGTARTYAEKLGDIAAADILQETLNEEGLADQKLTRLALRNINFEALAAS